VSRKEWSASAEVKEAAKEGLAVFREFRDFAVRGNVVDMAVGIIVGAAFGTVVKSLVSDIIMPPFGLLFAKVNFSDLYVELGRSSAGPIKLAYGAFIDNVLSFLIVSFVVFLVVRQMNRFRKQQEQPPVPTTKECPYCLSAIPLKATRCAHCTSELPGEAKVAS
jgi:large conductance mechanosensitive channel